MLHFNSSFGMLLCFSFVRVGLEYDWDTSWSPIVTPQVLLNPNCRSILLTVVKSQSTWVLTSKTSPIKLNDSIDQVNTHL
jgi:hypothetical protein